MGIQFKWDPSRPDPTLGVQIQREGKGPTCEYLYFMPRYRYRGI